MLTINPYQKDGIMEKPGELTNVLGMAMIKRVAYLHVGEKNPLQGVSVVMLSWRRNERKYEGSDL